MYLQHLYPQPNAISEHTSRRYVFGAEETLYVNRALSPEVAERFRALWNRFSFTASTLTVSVKEDGDAHFCAWLGKRGDVPTPSYYAIRATETDVTLSAVSEKALVDGFTTLCQLICPDVLDDGAESLYITAAEIDDAPSIGFRSVHFCIFPESAYATLEKAVHLAGFLKFTHVVFEFWGTFPYECCPSLYWEGYAWTKAQIRALVSLARGYGMEVIPMFNHVGHASNSRVGFGRHTTLNANPRLARLFEPDGWTWCMSNPKTKALLADVRAELMDICGDGAYFHIGADETYSFATCDRCRTRVPHELLAEYVNELTADLAKYGRRPIMWHDELINASDFKGKDPIVANGHAHKTADAIALLDRRVIIADWQYDYVSRDNPTTPYFMEQGFDTLLCPWDKPQNIQSMCDDARRLGAYGVMLTTWDHLPAYLRKFGVAGNFVWSGINGYSTTEAAAILRTLYDTKGDYLTSGWHKNEVEE